jgi:hypothetical protein
MSSRPNRGHGERARNLRRGRRRARLHTNRLSRLTPLEFEVALVAGAGAPPHDVAGSLFLGRGPLGCWSLGDGQAGRGIDGTARRGTRARTITGLPRRRAHSRSAQPQLYVCRRHPPATPRGTDQPQAAGRSEPNRGEVRWPPTGDPMAADGDLRRQPTGRFPWPPSVVTRHAERARRRRRRRGGSRLPVVRLVLALFGVGREARRCRAFEGGDLVAARSAGLSRWRGRDRPRGGR